MNIGDIFERDIEISGNLIHLKDTAEEKNQSQTNDTFTDKWAKVEESDDVDELEKFQFEWYLTLYGFESEQALQEFLKTKKVIFDAGCGLGYKAAWFAKLAPSATVIGMDYSGAAVQAANKYRDIPNLYFVQGDIADTGMKQGSIDYVSCDQVIMHTENPEATFAHLASRLTPSGEFACYVYAKKALPRELLDDYFRAQTHEISREDLWEMSSQLTELGKVLSELEIEIQAPDIPLLGIKGGKYDIQRFIYWNFIKCFWREEWGKELCDSTNFDWYSPSNAKRYSEQEFRDMISSAALSVLHFHSEEACYSGRFANS